MRTSVHNYAAVEYFSYAYTYVIVGQVYEFCLGAYSQVLVESERDW